MVSITQSFAFVKVFLSLFSQCRLLPSHESLDFRYFLHNAGRKVHGAFLGDEKIVFDAHANAVFGEIKSRLIGNHGARRQGGVARERIVRIESDAVGNRMKIHPLDLVRLFD